MKTIRKMILGVTGIKENGSDLYGSLRKDGKRRVGITLKIIFDDEGRKVVESIVHQLKSGKIRVEDEKIYFDPVSKDRAVIEFALLFK